GMGAWRRWWRSSSGWRGSSGGRVSGRERIHCPDAGRDEVCEVPRDDDQVVDERCRCNLLVDLVLGMGCAQSAPDLRRFGFEGKDAGFEVGKYGVEPALEPFGLFQIAAMANRLDATSEFAERDGGQVDRRAAIHDLVKKAHHARVGPAAF